ncbi:MAG: protein-glutamate O-methyltransferase CheR [Planctomycetota bacterium]|nr:protein-glutamate O-methyltransferase CheR [Planctomycetota bacterium]
MSRTWTSNVHEAIARLVSMRTGFTYALQHPGKTEAGVLRAMQRRGLSAPAKYLDTLRADAAALDELMDELTIRETYFFREPRHFEFIRQEILPQLRSERGFEVPIRAWSAGCASGEEAYSLAMLLAQEGFGHQSQVLGTDISNQALETARSARFRAWSVRGADPKLTGSYLRQDDATWIVAEPIRRRVRFGFLNLALDAYPSHVTGTYGMDLVMCRNVLIYFDADTVEQVARRLCASLAPGGWLVTASSDPALSAAEGLEAHVTDYGVFYQRAIAQRAAPKPVPPRPLAIEPPTPRAPAPAPTLPSPTAPAREVATPSPLAAAKRALRAGDYARVLEVLPAFGADVDACLLRIDALANHDGSGAAAEAAARALRIHPAAVELHFRHALLLSSIGRLGEAEAALRRVIYLDRSLAIAHFTLAGMQWRQGRQGDARRSYQTAERLARAASPDAPLRLAPDQAAGALADAASRQLAALDGAGSISA